MVGRFYGGGAMSTREPLHDQRKDLFYYFVFTREELAAIGDGEVG